VLEGIPGGGERHRVATPGGQQWAGCPWADRCAGHLPGWFEVGGGLPRRRPAAQAVRRHAGRGSSDQARARRRGARAAARPDAARVQPRLAWSLRRQAGDAGAVGRSEVASPRAARRGVSHVVFGFP